MSDWARDPLQVQWAAIATDHEARLPEWLHDELRPALGEPFHLAVSFPKGDEIHVRVTARDRTTAEKRTREAGAALVRRRRAVLWDTEQALRALRYNDVGISFDPPTAGRLLSAEEVERATEALDRKNVAALAAFMRARGQLQLRTLDPAHLSVAETVRLWVGVLGLAMLNAVWVAGLVWAGWSFVEDPKGRHPGLVEWLRQGHRWRVALETGFMAQAFVLIWSVSLGWLSRFGGRLTSLELVWQSGACALVLSFLASLAHALWLSRAGTQRLGRRL